MSQTIPSNNAAVALRLDRSPPLSSMCREIGMAAVAAELCLRASELELDAAVAVERGAAALFLAGFGPKAKLASRRPRAAKTAGRKNGRSATKPSRGRSARAGGGTRVH